MKYLPCETCRDLVYLGCTSESSKWWHANPLSGLSDVVGSPAYNTPAFSLEDILQKDNAEKIVPSSKSDAYEFTHAVLTLVWDYPDTWPAQVSKLIMPTNT